MANLKERLSLVADTNNRSNIARLFDGFFLIRPTLIFPLWTLVLAGHRLVKNPDQVEPGNWFLLSVALTALFGLVYLLNQMRDREGDRYNNKSLLIAREIVSRRTQITIGILLGITAPAALILSGFGHLGLWMIATFAIAGILYNYTPAALEKTPFGGIISGATGGWLLLRLGESIAGDNAGFIAELPYVLSFSAGCLLTSLPDLTGDKETGKKTFAVTYGERKTVILAGVIIAIAGIIGSFTRDYVILLPALSGTILISMALIKRKYTLAVAGNKLAIFLLALSVAIVYPVFLTAIFLYLPLAKWYHRCRFGMDYPNFRAEYAGDSSSRIKFPS